MQKYTFSIFCKNNYSTDPFVMFLALSSGAVTAVYCLRSQNPLSHHLCIACFLIFAIMYLTLTMGFGV